MEPSLGEVRCAVAVIRDASKISQEVLDGQVFGAVKLYNLDDRSKPESSARRILGMTYPTQALRQAMAAIGERIEGKRRQGTFVFAGDYGTGKSHSLLALYHLLTSPESLAAESGFPVCNGPYRIALVHPIRNTAVGTDDKNRRLRFRCLTSEK